MKAKLTLSIEDSIVQKSKRWAKIRGDSLSGIIEDFLKSMLEKGSSTDFNQWKESVQLEADLPADFNWKKERERYLIEKYG